MFYLIKSFLLSKWTFKFPLQKQILVYDSHSAELASIFFKKKNYSILNVRLEEINILILIKVLIKKGFKNLKNNYYGYFINYVNPRLIITFVDNNLNFIYISAKSRKST